MGKTRIDGKLRGLLGASLLIALTLALAGCSNGTNAATESGSSSSGAVASFAGGVHDRSGEEIPELEGDLVIPVNGISETATFYPVMVDGMQMEVLVVKASDGSIRTAFNTCEVCYATGLGYYEQEGTTLICQNCKNVFEVDQVGLAGRGACHPYSIFEEERTIDATNITFPHKLFEDTKEAFLSWIEKDKEKEKNKEVEKS